MITSRHQNVIQNQNTVIGNLWFENVEKFRYLGETVTNTNDIHEEIKRRINMGNACYYSFEKILSSRLLSKELKVNTYKTIILPVVLYGCETWSLTLRELHNAELHALYSSPNMIRSLESRRLRWAGHVARMEQSRNAYRVLVGKPERKKPLGRPRRRWEDNIKMDLREVGFDYGEWIDLAEDRDQWRANLRAVMNLRVT